jgi:hypothetical protein
MRFVMLIGIIALLTTGCGTGGGAGAAVGPALSAESADAAPPAAAALVGERIDNPIYASWAKFPKGTAVVYREVTSQNNTETVTIKTFTLADLTDELAIVEMQATTTTPDGTTTEYPPITFRNGKFTTVAPDTDRQRIGKAGKPTEEGEETLEIAGRTFRTTWYKTKGRVEAGEELIQIWSSEEVPGGLVKSVNQVPVINKLNTVELVEIKTP